MTEHPTPDAVREALSLANRLAALAHNPSGTVANNRELLQRAANSLLALARLPALQTGDTVMLHRRDAQDLLAGIDAHIDEVSEKTGFIPSYPGITALCDALAAVRPDPGSVRS